MPHASQPVASSVAPDSHGASSSPTARSASHELATRLGLLIGAACETQRAAPCIIARDLDSPVVAALIAARPALRAHDLTPLLLLGERPDARRIPNGALTRVVTPDVASLLHEQAIIGDQVWCGGAASARAPQALGPGRLFASLSATELRAFVIVFQGLWASGRPVAAPEAREEPASRPFARSRLASGTR